MATHGGGGSKYKGHDQSKYESTAAELGGGGEGSGDGGWGDGLGKVLERGVGLDAAGCDVSCCILSCASFISYPYPPHHSLSYIMQSGRGGLLRNNETGMLDTLFGSKNEALGKAVGLGWRASSSKLEYSKV